MEWRRERRQTGRQRETETKSEGGGRENERQGKVEREWVERGGRERGKRERWRSGVE